MTRKKRRVVYGAALGLAIISSLTIPRTRSKKVSSDLLDANGILHELPQEDTIENQPTTAKAAFTGKIEPEAPVDPAPAKDVSERSLSKLVDHGFSGSELMGLHLIEDRHQRRLAFIQRFHLVAMIEQQKYGIPASITLAQGILESDAGASELATFANNYFGIKCHKRSHQGGKAPWHCKNHADDDPQDVFVKFKTPWESFRRHSKVLKKKRYRKCFENDLMNYYGWADDLKACGYATAENYNVSLASLVERYGLNQFTEAAMSLTIK